MDERRDVPLAPLTTLRLGGAARTLVEVDDAAELARTVERLDDAGEPVLVLGGGSNAVVCDEPFAGTVVLVRTRGIDVDVDACSGAMVTARAGEPWDELVAHAVEHRWVGIEALAGIPGLVGAVPIQNVGAYGQDVAQTIARVHTFDRRERRTKTFAAAECGFSYRTSRFKAEPGRYLIESVTFQLGIADLSAPVRYAELARSLGVAVGERAPTTSVRDAVLALRRRKGMVLDPADHDTWSAGSFFTNPVLSPQDAAALLPAEAPRWPQSDGSVKTSAAWLIDQAGFTKGYGSGPARISGKHTLALTNTGAARTADLLELAREIRTSVTGMYGITLVPEPVLVGCSL